MLILATAVALALPFVGAQAPSGIIDAVSDQAALNSLLTGPAPTYVIVGGGTAGLALAARLSERSTVTVAVLEAGTRQDANPGIFIPAQAGSALGTDIDWGYSTTPQENANGRSIYTPRGKVLGGSSAINFLIYTRGTKAEYDAFQALGNPTWNWDSIQQASKKSEKFTLPFGPTASNFTYDSSAHGTSGPVDVSFPPYLPPQFGGFTSGLRSLGVPSNRDINDGTNAGVALSPSTVQPSTQMRETSQTAYINGILSSRPNLVLVTRAQVTKINWGTPGSAGVVASGVTFVAADSVPLVLNAGKEVILAAGAIQSPQLLELSGVGNPAILAPQGIATVVNLPGVGENLQDHPAVVSVYRLKDPYQSLDDFRWNSTLLAEQSALYATQRGMLTHALSALAYLTVNDFLTNSEKQQVANLVAASAPGISQDQCAAQAAYLLATPILELVAINVFFGATTPEDQVSYISIATCLQHSFSRGTVHIASSNPLAAPAIDPNYLQHPVDKYLLARGAKYVRRLANTAAFQRFIASEQEPGPAVSTDAQWEAWVQQTVRTEYHPVSTTSMLPLNKRGVVDSSLKVYGTANVRVVDLSIVPLHVSAHPQSLAYAIAEKVAPIILAS